MNMVDYIKARSRLFWPAIILVMAAIVLLRNAWTADDIYITFRTVDNLVNGLGLGWNITERTQAFTHPLWMLLLSAVYLFTREAYFTTIFISVAVTLAGLAVVMIGYSRNQLLAICAAMLLLSSKAFVDNSVGGLENPLTHLLLGLFLYIYLNPEPNRYRLFQLALFASLVALNRLDTILFCLPPLLAAFWEERSWKSVRWILLGFLPLIAWEVFSLFYFGFPFPNTAYAKLNTGIASIDLWRQGKVYVLNLFDWSWITGYLIILGLFTALLSRLWKLVIVSAGVILYLVYVVKIGGCYMSGRFFSAPLFVAVILILKSDLRKFQYLLAPILSLLIIINLFSDYVPLLSGSDFGKGDEKKRWTKGISDERAAWYQSTGYLVHGCDKEISQHEWAEQGRAARSSGVTFARRSGIGLYGYFAGPNIHILDNHALADPLLARLPVKTPKNWRIGHFYREAPPGYLESLKSGQNLIEDSSLSEYYEKLRLITRGDLWDTERFKTIIKFNLGSYSYLLDAYLKEPKRADYASLGLVRTQGTPYNCRGCLQIDSAGVYVILDSTLSFSPMLLNISVDCNDDYDVFFRNDSIIVGLIEIKNRFIQERGLRVDRLSVPDSIALRGFDQVQIVPHGGDGTYSVGHIIFHRLPAAQDSSE